MKRTTNILQFVFLTWSDTRAFQIRSGWLLCWFAMRGCVEEWRAGERIRDRARERGRERNEETSREADWRCFDPVLIRARCLEPIYCNAICHAWFSLSTNVVRLWMYSIHIISLHLMPVYTKHTTYTYTQRSYINKAYSTKRQPRKKKNCVPWHKQYSAISMINETYLKHCGKLHVKHIQCSYSRAGCEDVFANFYCISFIKRLKA